MKIGILTFHRAQNYGAVLQAFALQRFLTINGYDVEIIDYRPEYIEKVYKIFRYDLFRNKNYKEFLASLLTLPIRIIKDYKFKKFNREYFKLSETSVFNDGIIPKDYNAFIFGSDQIWNTRLTNGFDKVFWGNFETRKGTRKIAFAPSMETVRLNSNEATIIKTFLENFDNISVREERLERLLQTLTQKTITTVLDPTLILGDSIFNKMVIEPKTKYRYVLVYDVRSNKDTLLLANNIAKQLNCKVVEIKAWITWRIKRKSIQVASPEEFVGLIKNSECVISTSYHCIIFSIIYNRPFYSLELNDGFDGRVKDLLTRIDLSDRIVFDKNVNYTEIDYEKTKGKLSLLREKSISYIMNSIKMRKDE